MKKNNILFFTCFNTRSIQLESIIYYFQSKGNNVSLLTICEKGPLHHALETNHIPTTAVLKDRSFRTLYYFNLIRYLIRYTRNNNVDFIHSHLQIPNLISSFSHFFIKAIVFNVRHNSDVVILNGSIKEKLIDKLINIFSNNIIAISKKVKSHLIEIENVDPRKIHLINNGYNFIEYEKLSAGNGEYLTIKKKYNDAFLIISIGRLIKTKRHDLTILGVKILLSQGFNIKLLILDDGPEKKELQKMIIENDLERSVFLLGYIENISDYLRAADLVAVLSESEASNNSIKEAGYFEKAVIACEDVGDFSDYIASGVNGILIQKKDPLNEFTEQTGHLYKNKMLAAQLGKKLKETVTKLFDISSVGKKYEALQNKLQNK